MAPYPLPKNLQVSSYFACFVGLPICHTPLNKVAMTYLAAGMAGAPLTTNCLLGCAAVFLAATILDGYAAKDASGRLKAGGLWVLRCGWVLLTAMLAYQGLHAHTLPMGSTPELLLTFGWGLTALYGFLDLTFNHRLPVWAIAATTTLCLVAAASLGLPATQPDITAKPMIVLHVATAVLAYCILGAQALNSLAYLLQHRALAERRFGGIYTFLPALVPLERIGGNCWAPPSGCSGFRSSSGRSIGPPTARS